MGDTVLCPNCLTRGSIRLSKNGNDRLFYTCANPDCPGKGEEASREYATDTDTAREVISAVGFPGHGKSVFFGVLFDELRRLAECWSGFYPYPIDEHSLEMVRDTILTLRAGNLPETTVANVFPKPAVMKFQGIPPGPRDLLSWSRQHKRQRYLIFYDVSGETFRKATKVERYASYVKYSRTVFFVMSLVDLKYNSLEMESLINAYVQGMTNLQASTKGQNLCVVLTKGDELEDRLRNYSHIWEYLCGGTVGNLKLKDDNVGEYMRVLKRNSEALKHFIGRELGGQAFLHMAKDRFKSVDFCIVSALGAEPDKIKKELTQAVTPKRVLDPLIWLLYN